MIRRIASLAAACLSLYVMAVMFAPDLVGYVKPAGVVLGFVLVKLPSPQNVAVSNTAISNIPVGVTYRTIFAAITDNAVDPVQAVISARYTRWVLKANGVIKWDLSGTLLQEVNAYRVNGDRDGIRSLWLTDPKSALLGVEDMLAWGTGDLQSLTLEIDVGAAAVNPLIDIYAFITPPRRLPNGQLEQVPLGVHRIVQSFLDVPGGANSEFMLVNLPPRLPGRFVEKLHMKASAGAINGVRILVNQQELYKTITKVSRSLNDGWWSPYVWQTNYFHFDPTVTRRPSDALYMNVADLRVLADVSAAMNLTSIWEMIDATRVAQDKWQSLGLRYA